MLLFVPALLLAFFSHTMGVWAFGMTVNDAALASFICRRLAYPGLTDEQMLVPEPPTPLFPK
jgi:hypothetical protein